MPPDDPERAAAPGRTEGDNRTPTKEFGTQHTTAVKPTVAVITGEVVPFTLAEHEVVIERGLRSFVDVGNSLIAIRIGKLHREAGYETFDAYMRERWGIGKSRGYQLMTAAAMHESIGRELETSTIVDTPLPERESQVRPLVTLDPADATAAWSAAVDAANGDQPTAAQVEQAVAQITVEDDDLDAAEARELVDEINDTQTTIAAELDALRVLAPHIAERMAIEIQARLWMGRIFAYLERTYGIILGAIADDGVRWSSSTNATAIKSIDNLEDIAHVWKLVSWIAGDPEMPFDRARPDLERALGFDPATAVVAS